MAAKDKERYLMIPDYQGFPTRIPASKALEFQKEQEALKQKIESGQIPDPRESEQTREFNRKLEEWGAEQNPEKAQAPKTE